MTPRLHVPEKNLASGQVVALPKEARHYLLRVMRRRVEDAVVIFDGEGSSWQGIIHAEGPPLTVLLHEPLPDNPESPLRVSLVVGLCKPAAFELILQKSVELGVSEIIPVASRRAGMPLKVAKRKNERWQRIVVEATEQCGRTTLPDLHAAVAWRDLGESLAEQGERIFFWERAQGRTLRDLDAPVIREISDGNDGGSIQKRAFLTVMTGPEGGFSEEEVNHARDAWGFTVLELGPRILRAETAAIVALGGVQLLWGDLG